MEPMVWVRALIVGLVSALIVSACGGSSGRSDTPLEPVTLKLNWYHSVQFLGFYIAQERGFYADEGLDVTIIRRESDDFAIPEETADGVYDFTVGGTIQYAQSDGKPVTAIAALYQFGPETFFARADSGIYTLKDLAGHSIVVKSSGWEKLLSTLLSRAGLTLDDVEVVEGDFDMTPFFTGDVEVWAGYVNDEVVRARMAGIDVVTLPVYEYGIVSVAQVVATGATKIATDPDQVERFLRGTLLGWEWALDHPEDAVDIMLARYPDLDEDRHFYVASFDAIIPIVRPPGFNIGAIDCALWVQDERLANLESTDGLCNAEFLESIWEQSR